MNSVYSDINSITYERRVWCIIIAVILVFVIGLIFLSNSSSSSSIFVFILWILACALLIISVIFSSSSLIIILIFLLILLLMLIWVGVYKSSHSGDINTTLVLSTLIIVTSCALLVQCGTQDKARYISLYATICFIVIWLALIGLKLFTC